MQPIWVPGFISWRSYRRSICNFCTSVKDVQRISNSNVGPCRNTSYNSRVRRLAVLLWCLPCHYLINFVTGLFPLWCTSCSQAIIIDWTGFFHVKPSHWLQEHINSFVSAYNFLWKHPSHSLFVCCWIRCSIFSVSVLYNFIPAIP